MTNLYEKAAINSVTGDLLQSRVPTADYRNNYDSTFALSWWEMNKLFKKQHESLYDDGWRLYAVLEDTKSEVNVRVLLKNEDGGMIERYLIV